MLDKFTKYLKRDRKSIKTISLYTRIVKEFIEWYTQHHSCEFHCLKRKDVLEFRDYLKDTRKLKLQTIEVKMIAIAKFNKFLIYNNFQSSRVL